MRHSGSAKRSMKPSCDFASWGVCSAGVEGLLDGVVGITVLFRWCSK